MARIGRLGFLAIAVVFHLVYIKSIFDIYFISPIVHGMKAYSTDAAAPAKRLFLIVGDGLRADKCFQQLPDPDTGKTRHLAPFIRSRVLNEGTFGVSHTRVPTESRPGHVALIAGLYEDVSAVTTGWKLNPVNFDSVFNRSRHTWSWGSADILPMFAEGATPGRVDAYTYGEEMEDFTSDATLLDTWVFDRVQAFFEGAMRNETLREQLQQNKLVFFLHLLGLDTSGHGYRPYSKEYYRNLKVVDEGVEKLQKTVDAFYNNDGKTAWVFTADHGMSDWGSHGDGHPDNTRTPLVAWGAGVKKPVKAWRDNGHEDGFSKDWRLGNIKRNDVAQADVAALMAYLVGVEFPVNSVGELPLDYLSAPINIKAKAAYANTRGILEQYRVKEEKKMATELRYRPYPALSGTGHSLEDRFSQIEELINQGQYEAAIDASHDLRNLGIQGLRYLQTYDWLFLRTLVTAGYLGWIAYAVTTVLDMHVLGGAGEAKRTAMSSSFFVSVLIAIYAVLFIQQSPIFYYAYAFFPAFFWEEVSARVGASYSAVTKLVHGAQENSSSTALVVNFIAAIALLELMVYGYFRREVFTGCFLAGALWPLTYGVKFIKNNRYSILTWAGCCIVMSTFTMLPVVKVESLNMILGGGALMIIAGFAGSTFQPLSIRKDKTTIDWSSKILGLQTALVSGAMIVTRRSVTSLQAKEGLKFHDQVGGWVVIVASLLVPLLHTVHPRTDYLHRVLVIFLTFAPTFVILTISYEGIFYTFFSLTLLMWVSLETSIDRHRAAQHQEKLDALAKAEAAKLKAEKAEAKKKAKAKKPVFDRMETAKPSKLVKAEADKEDEAEEKKQVEEKAPVPEPPKVEVVETKATVESPYRPLHLSDTRIALFFFFFIQVAFFGTGNIASISSFSLDSVYRLIPIFNPFTMGALLIYKILIPFTLISAFLGILNKAIGMAPSAVFMVVMAISDVLTLNFFYMVKDEGSWLEIGSTISHFCIASLLFVFVSALELLSGLFVRGIKYDRAEEERAKNEYLKELEAEWKEKELKKLDGEVEKKTKQIEKSNSNKTEGEKDTSEKQEQVQLQRNLEEEVEMALRKVQRVKGVIDSEEEGEAEGYTRMAEEGESDAETVMEESDAETVTGQ
ncbi:PigN-domain-containing protein [Ascobolus immersus RN42]|uniref:GPI ethanolamine phosphate transferase 1 n=1 Tax=Ascobolus immersus RN42 TaxID=1160509 RepID=A0A3N4HJE7_ASCIM|nr:PigN-domain-containing protein [Ascobolus immersus RN42]